MSLDDFFEKANKVYGVTLKVLNKAVKMSKTQYRSNLRTSSDEQLRKMEKKLSENGGSPVMQSLLHEEMRRRNMV